MKNTQKIVQDTKQTVSMATLLRTNGAHLVGNYSNISLLPQKAFRRLSLHYILSEFSSAVKGSWESRNNTKFCFNTYSSGKSSGLCLTCQCTQDTGHLRKKNPRASGASQALTWHCQLMILRLIKNKCIKRMIYKAQTCLAIHSGKV